MLALLVKAAEQHVDDFDPQGLANTTWSFAKAELSDAQMFMELTKKA